MKKDKIIQELTKAVKEAAGQDVVPQLEHPGQAEHGDYATNVAMLIWGKGKKVKWESPMELAEAIVSEIRNSCPPTVGAKLDILERVEAVNPGFINFYLSKKALLEELSNILAKGGKYGKSSSQKKKVVLEHTSPNTNKPLHLGHVRLNALGSSMARILERVGAEVIPVEVINDRGVHIMQGMWGYLRFGKAHPRDKTWQEVLGEWNKDPEGWTSPQKEGLKPDHFIGRFYVLAQKAKDEDEAVGDSIQAMLNAWEKGDKDIVRLWKKMNDWYFEGSDVTYRRLGSVRSERFFESEIYKAGKRKVLDNVGKVFQKDEDGAILAKLSKFGLPDKVVLRADGTSIYITQDIALLAARAKQYKADQYVYLTGIEQDLYFKQLFAIGQLLGIGSPASFRHVGQGMVRLTSGKMSSRLGTVVNADDLMDSMTTRAKEIMGQVEVGKEIDDPDLPEKIGIGALKYAMLAYNPSQEIVFDPATTISFDGNSGPYLQYTYARTQSILAKTAIDYGLQTTAKKKKTVDGGRWTVDLNSEELAILRYLYRFPEVIQEAAQSYAPNILCAYLNELAQKFNTFYNKHRILEDYRLQTTDYRKKRESSSRSTVDSRQAQSAFRLALTGATGTILKSGLELLGIEAPERM